MRPCTPAPARRTIRCPQSKGVPIPTVTLELTRDDLSVRQEKAILVSVALPHRPWIGTDPLDELAGLATTAGATVVGSLLQRRQQVHHATYVGKGKVQELTDLVKAADADVVIFDNELTPAQ